MYMYMYIYIYKNMYTYVSFEYVKQLMSYRHSFNIICTYVLSARYGMHSCLLKVLDCPFAAMKQKRLDL